MGIFQAPRLSPGPEREYSNESILGFVHQRARVVAKRLSGLETSQGDLRRKVGGGLVGSAVGENLTQLLTHLLHLCGFPALQIWVLFDDLKVTDVALRISRREG